jgi:hypothetical protein
LAAAASVEGNRVSTSNGLPKQRASKRHRSPSVPCLDPLEAAMRAHQLYEGAGQDWVTPADAAKLWGFGPKSSTALRIVAALIAYELVEATTEPGTRQIRVSDRANSVFADPDAGDGPGDRLLVEAALKPKLVAQYAKLWLDGRPGDAACITQLKLRHRFTDETAARFLEIFDLCIGLVRDGPSPVRREGETAMNRGKPAQAPPPATLGVASDLELNRPKLVQQGSRLEITANLDVQGLRRLQRMLPSYREILELSSFTADQQPNPRTEETSLGERQAHAPAAFPILGLQWASQHAF